ncbi:hypothetical protein [Bradyrhizobium centrosematis]|uniref:hypothetical protein n=1 Tax=Bradyrhizobium centrosematis TaxID=1300039 RepID=UPI003890C957
MLWKTSEFAADAGGASFRRQVSIGEFDQTGSPNDPMTEQIAASAEIMWLSRFGIAYPRRRGLRTVFVQPFAQMSGAPYPIFCTPADKLFAPRSRTLPITGPWQAP